MSSLNSKGSTVEVASVFSVGTVSTVSLGVNLLFVFRGGGFVDYFRVACLMSLGCCPRVLVLMLTLFFFSRFGLRCGVCEFTFVYPVHSG